LLTRRLAFQDESNKKLERDIRKTFNKAIQALIINADKLNLDQIRLLNIEPQKEKKVSNL
jgi:hypothetical protein